MSTFVRVNAVGVYTTYTYNNQVTTMASIQPSARINSTYFSSFLATHRVDPTGIETPFSNYVYLRFVVDAMAGSAIEETYMHQNCVNLNSSNRHINTIQLDEENYRQGVPLSGNNITKLVGEYTAWYRGTDERWNTPTIIVRIEDYNT